MPLDLVAMGVTKLLATSLAHGALCRRDGVNRVAHLSVYSRAPGGGGRVSLLALSCGGKRCDVSSSVVLHLLPTSQLVYLLVPAARDWLSAGAGARADRPLTTSLLFRRVFQLLYFNHHALYHSSYNSCTSLVIDLPSRAEVQLTTTIIPLFATA